MMIAYHGSQSEKDAVLAQIQAHYIADEIVQGVYWQNGKGCAVGCTIHGSDHALYESRFGIPAALARIEDQIFEGLSNLDAKEWPLRFMRAIPVGADLSRVQWAFMHRILTDKSITPGITHPSVKDEVARVASLMDAWAHGAPLDESAADAARAAAVSAEAAAAKATRACAWSAAAAAKAATSTATWSAEAAAAKAATLSAEVAATWSVAKAMRAAADSAAQKAATSTATWSSKATSAYLKMADALIELLEAAPIAVLV